MRAADRAEALLQLIAEIEREREETSDRTKWAILDAEAMQLRAMYARLTAEAAGSPDVTIEPAT
jgi:hypothetical protein